MWKCCKCSRVLPLCSWSSTVIPFPKEHNRTLLVQVQSWSKKMSLHQLCLPPSLKSDRADKEVAAWKCLWGHFWEITIFHDGKKLSQGIPVLFHQHTESSPAMQNAQTRCWCRKNPPQTSPRNSFEESLLDEQADPSHPSVSLWIDEPSVFPLFFPS